jgi:hypothetical protein
MRWRGSGTRVIWGDVIASDPPSLAARATAGFESAEARSAEAEAKQSRNNGRRHGCPWIASSAFGLLAMTAVTPYQGAD